MITGNPHACSMDRAAHEDAIALVYYDKYRRCRYLCPDCLEFWCVLGWTVDRSAQPPTPLGNGKNHPENTDGA